MKKMKKIILITSGAYALFFAGAFLVTQSCHSAWCRIHDDDPLGVALLILLPLLPIFLLSLITYRMKDEVFHAWWSVARWWVPVIIVVTILLNSIGGGGGYLGMDDIFTGVVYELLYGILIFVSLYRIIRTYRALKKR